MKSQGVVFGQGQAWGTLLTSLNSAREALRIAHIHRGLLSDGDQALLDKLNTELVDLDRRAWDQKHETEMKLYKRKTDE